MIEFDESKIVKIKCSSCGKRLLNVLPQNNDQNLVHKICAECPFCGGSSNVETFIGLFATGPVDIEETISPTMIEDIEFNTDSKTSRFIIKKAKQ